MEEVADSAISRPPGSAAVEGAGTPEGLSILQKVLFLAVITACIAAYVRMSKEKEDTQAYEKSLV